MQAFFSWIWSGLEQIWEWYIYLWQVQLQFLWTLMRPFYEMWGAFFEWVIELLKVTAIYVLNFLMETAPGFCEETFSTFPAPLLEASADISQVCTVLSVVNSFFPLAEIFVCLTFYLSLVIAWDIYKLVKSYIPTISGS